jgi:hypothetical protein
LKLRSDSRKDFSITTDAQIAANRINAQASTGPRTVTGRARVSRNAVSSGLYSSGDFVRPEEQDLYAEFRAGFHEDLAPEGAVEQTLSAEIIHAAWRLRRCSVIEAGMEPEGELDPMLNPVQQAVDRARAQAQRSFHRATAELRRLQTERQFRTEFLPADFDTTLLGVASYKDMAPALSRLQKRERAVQPVPAAEPDITKQSQSAIGRNTPCPCGSGIKFKRCCGKGAPAVLNRAA